MKKLETISEDQILKEAFFMIMRKRDNEMELLEDEPDNEGMLADVAKYNRQLDELYDEIGPLEGIE